MSETSRPESGRDTPPPATVTEDLVRRFEQDWLAGHKPGLDQYLDAAGEGATSSLSNWPTPSWSSG